MNPIKNANSMISANKIQDTLIAITITTKTTTARQISRTILESNSITRSGSVYKRFIHSPTPISSKAIAGNLSILRYKSLLTFLVNLISKYVYK